MKLTLRDTIGKSTELDASPTEILAISKIAELHMCSESKTHTFPVDRDVILVNDVNSVMSEYILSAKAFIKLTLFDNNENSAILNAHTTDILAISKVAELRTFVPSEAHSFSVDGNKIFVDDVISFLRYYNILTMAPD